MKKPTSKAQNQAAVLTCAEVMERIMARLSEANEKLDYLIKNLRRFSGGNGHHDHCNHTLTEFMG